MPSWPPATRTALLPPSPGKRLVLVTGWADGEASPLSVAELPLFSPDIQLQADLGEPSCHGGTDGSIGVSATGGSAPYGYQWEGGATGDMLGSLTAGDYPVTVTDVQGCATFETLQLTEPDTLLASIGYTGLPAICNTSGTLAAVPGGGTLPYGYAWSNGPVDSVNADIGPGDYQLTVTDANGCEAFATATVTAGDTVLTVQPASICESENYPWRGNALSVDTLACEVFTLPNGCDSTTCLDLTVNPLPDV